MNRFLLVIAVLFALASLSVPTMAHAVASGDFWSVSGSDQCTEPNAAHVESLAFKSCGKKVNGQAVPCQPLPAVLPESADSHAEFGGTRFPIVQQGTPKLPVFHGWFRPPRG